MPQKFQPISRQSAFTLIELSIVLVIIGLLLGAILGGVQMLKQSEVQTIVSDYSKYSGAVANFRQQYGGLPGDLIDATNYWGDDATNCADGTVTNGTPGSCNGNNDGYISTGAEPYRAWQQLLLANYIKGSFTGIDTGNAVPGINVPAARISNAAWSFGNNTSAAGTGNWYAQDISNFLAIGTVTGDLTQGAALTPQDAWQLDKKMDNELPATGRIVTLKTTALANCATNDSDATATYKITDTSTACALNMSLTLK